MSRLREIVHRCVGSCLRGTPGVVARLEHDDVDTATRREVGTTSALSRLKVDLNDILSRPAFLDYHAFWELGRSTCVSFRYSANLA